MNSKRKIYTKRVVLTLLCLMMVSFIFYNSLCDSDSSSAQSISVREFLNNILNSLNTGITLSELFVRKLAHFTEFFILGALLFFAYRSYSSSIVLYTLFSSLTGLLVAACDECIQLFVPGRAGMFSDVMLDFSGVCTAVILMLILTSFVYKKSLKEMDKN